MALNVATLSAEIATAFATAQGGAQDAAAQTRTVQLATDLAAAIDKYVRAGTVVTQVTVAPGQGVVTAGGPTAQTGSTTTTASGTGTGSVQ